jgi:hypothetical protein
MHSSKATVSRIEGDSEDSAPSSLESAESHLAGCPKASSTCDGSGAAFSSTFGALVEWGKAHGLIQTPNDHAFFSRPTDGHGDEHEAWFDEDSLRWFKATYPNRFGFAWGRDGTATPHEYLRRLLLQNFYFSDDIQLVALLNCDEKLRVLTSQPHIAGDPAPYGEIQFWFQGLNYERIEDSGRIAWYHPAENLIISDAHEGNVIKTIDGALVPIDLNLIQPVGRLLEWVRSFF